MKTITLLILCTIFSASAFATIKPGTGDGYNPPRPYSVSQTKDGGLCLVKQKGKEGEKPKLVLHTHCEGKTGKPGSPYTLPAPNNVKAPTGVLEK